MRLTCPNCGAQYEVDDRVIPPEGRDVQCSNCGHTWFQKAAAAPTGEEPVPEPEAEPVAEDAAEEPGGAGEAAPDEVAPEEREEPAPATPEPQRGRRREVDEGVLDVLREEAEYENRARREEARGGLEEQPDLGLPGAGAEPAAAEPEAPGEKDAPEGRGLEAEISDMVGQEEDEDSSAARRDLLPDIEEINSSLRAASDRDDANARDAAGADDYARRRGRFRAGFLLMIIVIAAGIAVYAAAPEIARTWPGTEDALASYVDVVNNARIRLDAAMAAAAEMIGDFLEGA